MPLKKILKTALSTTYFWKITEPLEVLLQNSGQEAKNDYLKYKSLIHQKQFLAKNLLLDYLSLQDQIYYLPSGKPVLKDGGFVSVSHSQNWVAVALSDIPLGIDIETARPKLLKIASKFVCNNDCQLLDCQSVNQLQFLWTAKESIYKLMGEKGLVFKELCLSKIDLERKLAEILLPDARKISLFFNTIEDNFIICQAFFDK